MSRRTRDYHDDRALGYALRTPVASGVRHEFLERVNSNLCHLCWMPKGHIDHSPPTNERPGARFLTTSRKGL